MSPLMLPSPNAFFSEVTMLPRVLSSATTPEYWTLPPTLATASFGWMVGAVLGDCRRRRCDLVGRPAEEPPGQRRQHQHAHHRPQPARQTAAGRRRSAGRRRRLATGRRSTCGGIPVGILPPGVRKPMIFGTRKPRAGPIDRSRQAELLSDAVEVPRPRAPSTCGTVNGAPSVLPSHDVTRLPRSAIDEHLQVRRTRAPLPRSALMEQRGPPPERVDEDRDDADRRRRHRPNGMDERGRDPDADAVEPKARSTFCTILR